MVGVLGDPAEIRVDGVAEHGERDEGLTLKKRAAKFLLQRDNGIGQRGLGNAAAFGRAGEITLLAERQKVADLVHLHVPPRGINRASRPSLPSARVSKCEEFHEFANGRRYSAIRPWPERSSLLLRCASSSDTVREIKYQILQLILPALWRTHPGLLAVGGSTSDAASLTTALDFRISRARRGQQQLPHISLTVAPSH